MSIECSAAQACSGPLNIPATDDLDGRIARFVLELLSGNGIPVEM